LISASAPGKVILFGEHAVVSGVAALGGAINLRAKTTVEDLPGRVLIESSNLSLQGFSMDLLAGQILSEKASYAMRYISAVLLEYEAKDLRVKIESELPVAAGLGSSAAIVVATIAALNQHLGMGLSKKEIASSAHRIEKEVQHGLGSPMDTALATFGGYLLVSEDIQPLTLPQLEMIVGYSNQPHDTRSEVLKVQSLRERYPDLVEPIFQAIGTISVRAISMIQEQRFLELGELMNVNHGLLEAIGVGTRELSELVYAARGAGCALGAKLTGAGGGGCMIALPSQVGISTLMTSLKQARGVAFAIKTGCEGVRLEKEL
jgi:mevalonate kinase